MNLVKNAQISKFEVKRKWIFKIITVEFVQIKGNLSDLFLYLPLAMIPAMSLPSTVAVGMPAPHTPTGLTISFIRAKIITIGDFPIISFKKVVWKI